jgi:hypothetical protein
MCSLPASRLLLALLLALLPPALLATEGEDTYDRGEILAVAHEFFGSASEGLADVVEKIFDEQGRPNAYVIGEEVSGAIGVGASYGDGVLRFKGGGSRKVFWQGPSIGFDLGANASKVFVLVYDLPSSDALFQRFPGVDGSLYYVAGVGVNYQRSAGITLAPIRTGVGLRARASVGYMHYTRKRSWIPF